jgi:hypothetical protein
VINKGKIDAFYRKWGIEATETDLKDLQARVLDCVRDDVSGPVGYIAFNAACARVMGIKRSELDSKGIHLICSIVDKAQNVTQLMHSVQLLLWAMLDGGYETSARKFAEHLATIFAFTPNLDVEILISPNEIAIYPAGAKLLDDKAVKETIEWMAQYPEVGKHFSESLKIYAGKEVTRYRHLLDNLRFALEQMLRAVLSNQKSLENQREEALKWLASHKIHAHIVNMYNDLITKFASYQNDAVKHNEKYSPAEIEFMIYMTGTFLRFLVQLHSGQTAPALAVKTP